MFKITVLFGLLCLCHCTYDYNTTNVYTSDASTSVEDASSKGIAMRGWALTKEMTMGDGQLAGNVLNVNFPESDDGNAAEYTVQLGISQTPNAVAANGPPNLRAIIQWNTNGHHITRMVSVGGGTSISGSAEGVSVSLQDFSLESAKGGTYADYEVTVSCVPGVRASTSTPPTLIPLITEAATGGTTPYLSTIPGSFNIPASGFATVEVPQSVGVQSIAITPGINATADTDAAKVTCSQFDLTHQLIKSYAAITANGFIPLSPLCTYVMIYNGGSATADGVSVTWGIDG